LPQAVATGSLNRFFKLEETPVNHWDLSWQLSLLVGEREAMSSGLRQLHWSELLCFTTPVDGTDDIFREHISISDATPLTVIFLRHKSDGPSSSS
jgi:hypothetical protein